MIADMNRWLEDYVGAVTGVFGKRVYFIGLQGSYAREEAGESSDIDVVLILDELAADDLFLYRDAIAELPERDRICGFVSGLGELANWLPSELFQFYRDTKPVFGDLGVLAPETGQEAARAAVLSGACGVYHMCAHNAVHAQSVDVLRGACKSAVFTLQALHYLVTGRYVSRHGELLEELSGEDRDVMRLATQLKNNDTVTQKQFEDASRALLSWASKLIKGER